MRLNVIPQATRPRLEAGGTQELLRRMVGRLCIAARGVDEQLDYVLVDIRKQMRDEPDEGELEGLLSRLASVIMQLDSRSMEEPLEAEGSSESPNPRTLLHDLASRIEAPAGLAAVIGSDNASSSTLALQRVVERLADAINLHVSALEGDKRELERLLQAVHQQLTTIGGFIASEVADRTASQHTRHRLDESVRNEIRDLDEQIGQAEDPEQIRVAARSHLGAISGHLDEYESAEQARELSAEQRAAQMRARIEALERHTERLHQSLQQEHRRALTDALTSIPNRLAYDERVEALLTRVRQGSLPVVMLLWDIDHFKQVNDTYGHRAGDRVIRVFAQRLSRSIRAGDFIGRYGGEEFIMLLEGTTVDASLQFADQLREGLNSLGLHFRGTPVPVTASCGITALLPGDTAASAFERADRALYEAKHSGRNRCMSA